MTTEISHSKSVPSSNSSIFRIVATIAIIATAYVIREEKKEAEKRTNKYKKEARRIREERIKEAKKELRKWRLDSRGGGKLSLSKPG